MNSNGRDTKDKQIINKTGQIHDTLKDIRTENEEVQNFSTKKGNIFLNETVIKFVDDELSSISNSTNGRDLFKEHYNIKGKKCNINVHNYMIIGYFFMN